VVDVLRGNFLRVEDNRKIRKIEVIGPYYTKMVVDPTPRE
jgi:hypothetical protein